MDHCQGIVIVTVTLKVNINTNKILLVSTLELYEHKRLSCESKLMKLAFSSISKVRYTNSNILKTEKTISLGQSEIICLTVARRNDKTSDSIFGSKLGAKIIESMKKKNRLFLYSFCHEIKFSL